MTVPTHHLVALLAAALLTGACADDGSTTDPASDAADDATDATDDATDATDDASDEGDDDTP